MKKIHQSQKSITNEQINHESQKSIKNHKDESPSTIGNYQSQNQSTIKKINSITKINPQP